MTREEMATQVRSSVDFYERQLYQTRIDLAAAVGETETRAKLQAKMVNLTRGLAAIRKQFAAELAYQPPARKPGPGKKHSH